MNLNGLMVSFIGIGGAVILTGIGMGIVLLLTEDRRGRIFMQEIPAKFRHLVATPEHPAAEWVKPMHAAAPSALRAARHLAGLGHLLRPKGISEGRAAKLATKVYRRALLARVKTSPAGMANAQTRPQLPPAPVSTTRPDTQLLTRALGTQPGTAAAAAPAISQNVAGPPPVGAYRPDPGVLSVYVPPAPLPDLPPDGLDAACTYRQEPPLSMWLSDDTLARGIQAVK